MRGNILLLSLIGSHGLGFVGRVFVSMFDELMQLADGKFVEISVPAIKRQQWNRLEFMFEAEKRLNFFMLQGMIKDDE